MRRVPILCLATLLASGCWDSGTGSKTTDSGASFQPWAGLGYTNKVVLLSAPGRSGPEFLTVQEALFFNQDSGVSSLRLQPDGNPLAAYDLDRRIEIPWLDSELLIDSRHATSTVSFLFLNRTPRSVNEKGILTTLDLTKCPDLSAHSFAGPAGSTNSISAIVRSGRYTFLIDTGTRRGTGVALLRTEPISDFNLDVPAAGCHAFDIQSSADAFAAKWVQLLDTSAFGSLVVSNAVATDAGIYILVTGYPPDSSLGSAISYLAFLDTMGTKTVLDSSNSLGTFSSLVSHRGEVYALGTFGGVTKLSYPTWTPAIIQSGNPGFTSNCEEVQGRCILHTGEEILDFDPDVGTISPIALQGLAGNSITGVVQYRDTVYVSTLSGVFTKPLARFFDPAP